MRISSDLSSVSANLVSKLTEGKTEKPADQDAPASSGQSVDASLSPAAQHLASRQVGSGSSTDADTAAAAAAAAVSKIFGGGSGALKAQGGLDPDMVRALLGG
jgi:hypothetical protein